MKVYENDKHISIVILDSANFINGLMQKMEHIGITKDMAPNFKQRIFDNMLEVELLKTIDSEIKLEINVPYYLNLKLNNEIYKFLIVNIHNENIGNGLTISKTLQG